MKIRITILTENNLQRPAELTEEKVAKAWQLILDLIALQYMADDKGHVETVEFVDEEEED
jgi:hypothetical protein